MNDEMMREVVESYCERADSRCKNERRFIVIMACVIFVGLISHGISSIYSAHIVGYRLRVAPADVLQRIEQGEERTAAKLDRLLEILEGPSHVELETVD